MYENYHYHRNDIYLFLSVSKVLRLTFENQSLMENKFCKVLSQLNLYRKYKKPKTTLRIERSVSTYFFKITISFPNARRVQISLESLTIMSMKIYTKLFLSSGIITIISY